MPTLRPSPRLLPVSVLLLAFAPLFLSAARADIELHYCYSGDAVKVAGDCDASSSDLFDADVDEGVHFTTMTLRLVDGYHEENGSDENEGFIQPVFVELLDCQEFPGEQLEGQPSDTHLREYIVGEPSGFLDNCTGHGNPIQCDTDADGYGNNCDADYDDDFVVGAVDFGTFGMNFLAETPNESDHDCDVVVGAVDFGLFGNLFLGNPGPSEYGCAGSAPCP